MTSRKRRAGIFSKGIPKLRPPDEAASAAASHYLHGVVPLPPKPARIAPARPQVPAAPSPFPTPPLRSGSPAGPDAPDFEVSDDGFRTEGRRCDLDPEVVRRLRRGHVPIEAQLDLHGLSAAEARRQVMRFVARSHATNARVLLLIHGKGVHSPSGLAVLSREIPLWLTEPPTSRYVLCFTSARPSDGGRGALYVRLRS